MKFKNVSRLLIFVFFLSLIAFSQPQTTSLELKDFSFEWKIPESIIERYTELQLELLKFRLEVGFRELDYEVRGNFNSHKFEALGQRLAHQSAVFDVDGRLIAGAKGIAKLFSTLSKCEFKPPVIIECYDLPENFKVDGQLVDILAVLKFPFASSKKASGGDATVQDPSVTYFHRKVCTWF